jgi:hypothetical protein
VSPPQHVEHPAPARTWKASRPRLTKTFADDWFNQDGVAAGEARLTPAGEHRRFILMNKGQSLFLGMSLNSTDKNETARTDTDTADRPFFESVWAGAKPLA